MEQHYWQDGGEGLLVAAPNCTMGLHHHGRTRKDARVAWKDFCDPNKNQNSKEKNLYIKCGLKHLQKTHQLLLVCKIKIQGKRMVGQGSHLQAL
jgi:hypothetical protein